MARLNSEFGTRTSPPSHSTMRGRVSKDIILTRGRKGLQKEEDSVPELQGKVPSQSKTLVESLSHSRVQEMLACRDLQHLEDMTHLDDALAVARGVVVSRMQVPEDLEAEVALGVEYIWIAFMDQWSQTCLGREKIAAWRLIVEEEVSKDRLQYFLAMAEETRDSLDQYSRQIESSWKVLPKRLLSKQYSVGNGKGVLQKLAMLCTQMTREKATELLQQSIEDRCLLKKTKAAPSDMELKPRDVEKVLNLVQSTKRKRSESPAEMRDNPGPHSERADFQSRKAEDGATLVLDLLDDQAAPSSNLRKQHNIASKDGGSFLTSNEASRLELNAANLALKDSLADETVEICEYDVSMELGRKMSPSGPEDHSREFDADVEASICSPTSNGLNCATIGLPAEEGNWLTPESNPKAEVQVQADQDNDLSALHLSRISVSHDTPSPHAQDSPPEDQWRTTNSSRHAVQLKRPSQHPNHYGHISSPKISGGILPESVGFKGVSLERIIITDSALPCQRLSDLEGSLSPLRDSSMLSSTAIEAILRAVSFTDTTVICDALSVDMEISYDWEQHALPTDIQRLLLPLHHKRIQQWTLVEYDVSTRCIRYYDPLQGPSHPSLKESLRSLGAKATGIIDWTYLDEEFLIQSNPSDCGMHVIITAISILAATSLQMTYDYDLWRHIVLALLEEESQEDFEEFEDGLMLLPERPISMENEDSQTLGVVFQAVQNAKHALQIAVDQVRAFAISVADAKTAVCALSSIRKSCTKLLAPTFFAATAAEVELKDLIAIENSLAGLTQQRKRRLMPTFEMGLANARKEMEEADYRWSTLRRQWRQLRQACRLATKVRDCRRQRHQWAEEQLVAAQAEKADLERVLEAALDELRRDVE